MEIKEGVLVALKSQGRAALGIVRREQQGDGHQQQEDNRSFLVELVWPHSLHSEEVGVLAKDLTAMADTNLCRPLPLDVLECLPGMIHALLDRIKELERKIEEAGVCG